MDNTEIHYLTYEEEELWKEMVFAYLKAGGDPLYPGNEKEILLRGVEQILWQAFAGMDNALRMNTLRYALRDYLDLYAERRNCYRIKATAATSTVEITFKAAGEAKTIPAGTPITQDGEILYTLVNDVAQSGYAQVLTADIVCSRTGSLGNALVAGAEMQFLVPQDAVSSVFCKTDATGGQDEEDDETYRERTRIYGLATVTTGPEMQYKSAAMAVSSEIIDAHPKMTAAGVVTVYLLLAHSTGQAALIAAVQAALNPKDKRPLTDQVNVELATPIPYQLNVQYGVSSGSNNSAAIAAAVDEYKEWQNHTIGQAFNPDKLMALLYQAGCVRVIWGEGSHFNNGNVTYTTIADNAYCNGDVSLAVIST